jgi:hypothetical protein
VQFVANFKSESVILIIKPNFRIGSVIGAANPKIGFDDQNSCLVIILI